MKNIITKPFSAKRYTGNDVDTGHGYGWVDITSEALALSGELLKEAARRAKSMPREKISVTDKHYDENRAMAYCEAMIGERPSGVIWDHCNGEKRPRVRYCLFACNERWQIPNWDWNGHNQTVDDCRLETEIDIFA